MVGSGKSWGFLFFLTFVLEFAVVSSSPLMAYGRTVHRLAAILLQHQILSWRESRLHDDDALSVTPIHFLAQGHYITVLDAIALLNKAISRGLA